MNEQINGGGGRVPSRRKSTRLQNRVGLLEISVLTFRRFDPLLLDYGDTRIAAPKAELVLTRDACELFNPEAVVPPKRRHAITDGLITCGYSTRSACQITGLVRLLLRCHRRRPVPDREIRRLIVAETITEIHRRPRGTYGRRRVRAALLDDDVMNVNLKLVHSIMTESRSVRATAARAAHSQPDPSGHSCRSGEPALTATRHNELWCTDITELPARDGKVYLRDPGLFLTDDRGPHAFHHR